MVALAVSAVIKRPGGAGCFERAYVLRPLNVVSKVGPEADEKGCGADRLSVSIGGAVVGSPVCLAAAELEDFRGHPLAMHAKII